MKKYCLMYVLLTCLISFPLTAHASSWADAANSNLKHIATLQEHYPTEQMQELARVLTSALSLTWEHQQAGKNHLSSAEKRVVAILNEDFPSLLNNYYEFPNADEKVQALGLELAKELLADQRLYVCPEGYEEIAGALATKLALEYVHQKDLIYEEQTLLLAKQLEQSAQNAIDQVYSW